VTQAQPTRKQRRAQAEEEKHPSTGVEVEDIDAVLDDIDRLLAEEDEFLTRFRQRGGQ
jgi:ubiquitin-like protein Pup